MREADIALANARNNRTMAGYIPKVELSASWRRANRTNIDLGASGFLVGALTEGPLTVGACPDGSPNCVLDGGNQPVGAFSFGGVQTPPNNYTTQANLVIPLSDYALSLGLAREAAATDIEAAAGQREVAVAQADTDARVAYYQWIRALAQVAIAEQAVVGAEARLADARLGEQGGMLAPADVLQVETVLASAKLAVSDAKNIRELARRTLAVLMGEPEREFVIGEDVLSTPPSLPGQRGAGDLSELLEHARAHRVELRALSTSIRALELGVNSASAGLYPRVDGIVNITYANPNPQYFPLTPEWNASWFVGVTATWALDRYYATKAQLAELRANVQALEAQRATILRGVQLEVLAAWQEWQRARGTLSLSQTELNAAEAAYSQRVTLYRGGEATTTDVVEAEYQRHNATLRNVGARIDLHMARAKLIRAAALADESRPSGAAPSVPATPAGPGSLPGPAPESTP